MKFDLTYQRILVLAIILLSGCCSLHAQYLLQAPSSTDEHNYKWYEASDTATVLGTESNYLVTEPGVYFATYEGTLCGKNATEYFIVTYCNAPDNEVTMNITNSVDPASNVSWIPSVIGDQFQPTVQATESIETYTASITKAGNTFKIASFTMVCILKESTLNDDYAITDYGQAVEIDILANDIDIPTTSGQIQINQQPQNGTVVINDNGTPNDPSDDTVTYTPNAGFSGQDTFTYIVTGAGNEATVYVTVNPDGGGLVIVDDVYQVDSTDPSSVIMDVLANDQLGIDGVAVITSVTGALNGTVVINDDETVTYTPDQGYEGVEILSYTITVVYPGGATQTGSGQITINVTTKKPGDEIRVYQLVTPNGDGRNDILIIENIDKYPENKVQVFNRWGAKVYETESYGQNGKVFDGTANTGLVIGRDKKVPSGVYYYVIEYDDSGNTRHLAGYFYVSDK